jgi:hypothetical protein
MIHNKQWIEEVNRKCQSLMPEDAVVAVWQDVYPQFATYTVPTNVKKRKAMRMMLSVSASFAKGHGWFPQVAFYFEPGRRNRVWDAFCGFATEGGEQEHTDEVRERTRKTSGFLTKFARLRSPRFQ